MAPTSRPEARGPAGITVPGLCLFALAAAWSTLTPPRRPLRGQGIVEYGLILSLSAALTVVLLVFFSGTLSAVLNAVGDAIDAAS